MGKRYEALHGGGWVAETSKKKRDVLYGRPLICRKTRHYCSLVDTEYDVVVLTLGPGTYDPTPCTSNDTVEL